MTFWLVIRLGFLFYLCVLLHILCLECDWFLKKSSHKKSSHKTEQWFYFIKDKEKFLKGFRIVEPEKIVQTNWTSKMIIPDRKKVCLVNNVVILRFVVDKNCALSKKPPFFSLKLQSCIETRTFYPLSTCTAYHTDSIQYKIFFSLCRT